MPFSMDLGAETLMEKMRLKEDWIISFKVVTVRA